MNKYQVANIKFGFKYLYNDYFNNNIENYLINANEKVDSNIIVNKAKTIKLPGGNLIGNNNPYFIINEDKKHLIFKDQKNIKILISHDYNYKNIKIILNENEITDLVEAEYVMSGLMFLELAMFLNYLPMHATALKVNGEAILFTGRSGIGKSTHAANWLKSFSDVEIINDDKPILEFTDNGSINVYGSPFSGAHKRNTNTKAKLKAIVLLEQGHDNKITKVSKNEVIEILVKNILRPTTNELWNKVIPLIELIYDNIKIVKLSATKDESSALAIYNYLFGGSNED